MFLTLVHLSQKVRGLQKVGGGADGGAGALQDESVYCLVQLHHELMASPSLCMYHHGPPPVVTCAPMCPVNTSRTAVFWISTT